MKMKKRQHGGHGLTEQTGIHIVSGVCLVIIRLTPQWVWQLYRGKPGLGNYALVNMERRRMLVLIAWVSNKSGTVEQIVPFIYKVVVFR
jgi:hypothetical protein